MYGEEREMCEEEQEGKLFVAVMFVTRWKQTYVYMYVCTYKAITTVHGFVNRVYVCTY